LARLQILIDFLNSNPKKLARAGNQIVVQTMLAHDLYQLARPEPEPGSLQRLITKINANHLAPRWVVSPTAHHEKGAMAEMVAESYYGLILECLLDGTLRELRRCSNCGLYFVARRRDQACCGDECREKNKYARRQGRGYVSAFRATKRSQNSTQEIDAIKLIKQGKDPVEVAELTGLRGETLDRLFDVNPRRQRKPPIPKDSPRGKVIHALRQVVKILDIESKAERRRARRA
jgi:uncharacterized OB-fold protein